MGELQCEGQIRFGPVPWDVSERLAQFPGNWLQYSPGDSAVVVRRPQPAGCPAYTAVPCELISLLFSIPSELRAFVPGGCLTIRDSRDDVMRIVVDHGEVHLQWAQKDFSHAVPVPVDTVLSGLDPKTARVNGWARFAGACDRAAELREFVERFEGLYPEGDLPSECEQNLVYVRFRNVNVGPRELIEKLGQLSESQDSLQAELEVGSFDSGSSQADFRIRICDGRMSGLQPSAWK